MDKFEFQTVINEAYVYMPEYEKLKGRKVRVLIIDEDAPISIKHNNDIDNFFDRFNLDL